MYVMQVLMASNLPITEFYTGHSSAASLMIAWTVASSCSFYPVRGFFLNIFRKTCHLGLKKEVNKLGTHSTASCDFNIHITLL
jgi:hypothetical protein